MRPHRAFFRWVACFVMAAWSIGALKLYSVIPDAAGLGRTFRDIVQYLLVGGHWYIWLLLTVVVSIFYFRISKEIALHPNTLVTALILLLTFVMGNLFDFRSRADFVREYAIFVLLTAPGALILFYCLLWKLFDVFNNIEDKTPAPAGRATAFYDRHPIPLTMGILLLCWSPYLLLFCPGSIWYDSAVQLNMYFGAIPFTTHHPPLSTWLMGVFVQLGRSLGAESMGVFIYILLQTIFYTFVISVAVKTLSGWRLPRYVTFAALVYFALFPIWPTYTNLMLKDTLYMIFFLLYQLLLIGIFIKKQDSCSMVYLFILSVLLTQFRNNGMFVVFFTAVACLLIKLPAKKRFFIVSCAAIAVSLIANNLLFPLLGIQKGSRREALSIPFQQVARYVKYYGNDVTAEEREAIGRVLDYDVLGEQYFPYIADPVKDTFNDNASTEDMKEFFSTWFQLYWKHPDAYWKAFLESASLYFYPSNRSVGDQGLLFPRQNPSSTDDVVTIDYTFRQWDSARRLVTRQIYRAATFTHGLRYLYRPGFYTWLLILLLSYLIYRKRGREIVCFVPVLVMLLTNIASPISGSVRYTLPIMIALPVLFGFVLSNGKKKESQQEQ
jgi:hypothetical protein